MALDTTRAMGQQAGRRRRRLVYSLLAVLLFVGLAPLASFAFKLIDTGGRALVTSQQEIELQLASSIAAQVDTFMEGQQQQMWLLAEFLSATLSSQRSRHPDRPFETGGVLSGVLDDQLVALRFTSLMGDYEQTLLGGADPPPELEALLAREFEKALVAEGLDHDRRVLVSDPILIGPRAFAGVALSVPVVSRGAMMGVLQGFVSTKALWNHVALSRATGHEIYMLDSKGSLFAHTDEGAVVARRDLRGLEIVQRFLAARQRSKETVAFSALREGGEVGYLGAYDPTSQGWGVFVQVETDSAYAPLHEMMRDTVTWAAVAIALAILVAIGFAGKLSRPLNQLAAVSRAFALGDYSARASVSARNEIGELASTFNSMAEQVQAQIERIREKQKETNDLFSGTIRALADAIDAKDPYTKGHSVRVEKFAVTIAQYMGLSEDEIRKVHVASLLHDVGKIGIDDAILKKPGSLTPEEFDYMKQHPEKGARIMGQIKADVMKEILPGMRHHHERYGGGGYPLGLKGEEIPLIARIVNVADTFDAMTTHRPYQSAFTFEAAVARINELKGSVCDPKVVEAFNRAYRSGEFDLEARAVEASRPTQPAEIAQG